MFKNNVSRILMLLTKKIERFELVVCFAQIHEIHYKSSKYTAKIDFRFFFWFHLNKMRRILSCSAIVTLPKNASVERGNCQMATFLRWYLGYYKQKSKCMKVKQIACVFCYNFSFLLLLNIFHVCVCSDVSI